MLVTKVDSTAELWRRAGVASSILPDETLTYSRATWAVLPPAAPRGGAAALPADVTAEVGSFLRAAAKVRHIPPRAFLQPRAPFCGPSVGD